MDRASDDCRPRVGVGAIPAQTVVAVGLFLPVHWASEPRDGSESFGLILPGLFRIRPGLTPLAAAGLVRRDGRIGRVDHDDRAVVRAQRVHGGENTAAATTAASSPPPSGLQGMMPRP